MHPLIKTAYDEIDQTMTLIDKHADRVVILAGHFSRWLPTLQHTSSSVAFVIHIHSDSLEEVGQVLESLTRCGFESTGDTLGFGGARQANMHYQAQGDHSLHAMAVVTERTPGSLFADDNGKVRWLSFDEIDTRMDDEAERALATDATAATPAKVEEGREYHEDRTVVINHTDGSFEEFPPACRHLVPA